MEGRTGRQNGDATPEAGRPYRSRPRQRNRTLLGCLTCRLRRVKCTLEQPACQNCSRLSLQCAGYDAKLKWLAYDGRRGTSAASGGRREQDTQRGAGRREIFTLTERKHMSQHLIECVTSRNQDRDLVSSLELAIDSLHGSSEPDSDERTGRPAHEARFFGPFGVFSLGSLPPSCSQKSADVTVNSLDQDVGSAVDATEKTPDCNRSRTDATSPDPEYHLPDDMQRRNLNEHRINRTPHPNPDSDQDDQGEDLTENGAALSAYGSSPLDPDTPNSRTEFPSPPRNATSLLPPAPRFRGQTGFPSHHSARNNSNEEPLNLDSANTAEIKMPLLHFQTHLALLLSPCPTASPAVRVRTAVDGALKCFGRLSLLGEAGADECASLYSLLGMAAAHMDAVYRGLRNGSRADGHTANESHHHLAETHASGNWGVLAKRYIHSAQTMLEHAPATHLISKEGIKNVLVTQLNLFTATMISETCQSLVEPLRRSVFFLSDISPRQSPVLEKSKKLLCLEYCLLQECVLSGYLWVLSHNSATQSAPDHIRLDLLNNPDIWNQFLPYDERSAGGPKMTISAAELHQGTGSPIPPSLLRLILRNALLQQQMHENPHTSIAPEIAVFENGICEWRLENNVTEDSSPSRPCDSDDSESSTDSDSDSDSGDGSDDSDSDSSTNHPTTQGIAVRLAEAHHTALLLAFFAHTKPSSAFLLRPLQQKLLGQIRAYIRAVDKAEADVGIASGIIWILKVMESATRTGSGNSAFGKKRRALWAHVVREGWQGR